MAITVKDLGLHLVDADALVTDVQKTSSVAKAAKDVGDLGVVGLSIPKLSGLTAYGIGEGGQKIASGEASNIEIKANKLVTSTVLTEEAVAGSAALTNAVFEGLPSANATKFDNIVLGVEEVPSAWVGFKSFSSLTNEIVLGAGEAAGVALDDALGLIKDGNATAILLTTSMLSEMRRQRVTNTGQRVFDFVDGTIDGIPYYTVSSSEKIAVVGNFNRAFFSITPFENIEGSAVRVKDAGNITDSLSVVHNLTDSNKYALIYEDMVGFNYEEDFFTKIVVESEDEGA